MQYDVVVVGAGAAGLMAASEAALRGRAVCLLEKNLQAGLKILISGGGRCNLTTTRSGADLERQYGDRRGRWLRHALRSFQPRALCELVTSLGVPLQEEDLEKIFPVSGRARDVLDALLRRARDAGVTQVAEAPMLGVGIDGVRYRIATPRGDYTAESLVLATGGLSYPKTGATGDGYAVARQFGHEIVRTVPHLAPLAVDASWVHELQGLVIDAELTLRGPDGEVLCVRRRPTLFTHQGLSGPAPMDLAGFVEECGGGCVLIVDSAPDVGREVIERALVDGARTQGRRFVQHLLPASIPERLRKALAGRAGVADTTAASLPKERRRTLVDCVKRLEIAIDRSLGFKAAEVTRGGVALHEVEARTMGSKLQPGLSFCGEILDVDGPIGGFNFQAAFATGRLAGRFA